MPKNTFTGRKRLFVLMTILISCMVLLAFRVGYWNIIKGDELQEEAISQWISDTVVMPKRGAIYDRNGSVLAQSAVSDTVVLVPEQIKEPELVADALSGILGRDRAEIYEKATTKTKTAADGTEKKVGEVWLQRQIPHEQSEEIKALKMKGVKLAQDVKRYYPNSGFASQTIGYTTMDGEGQTGIERRFDSVLEGRQGRLVAETDKFNNDIPNGQEMYIEPVNGQNVVLALDEIIQSFLETVCMNALNETGSMSVQGVVMDITTGEVLGLANIPEFDLNNIPRSDGELLSSLSANTVTATPYEPGNIMTMFTAAAALDMGLDGSEYNCEGKATVDGEEILCTAAHGNQSFYEAVANGCKVAAFEMAAEIGKKEFFNYIEGYGFGEKTGIEFPADTKGDVMAMKYASGTDVAKMSAGESMQISQMQLINAATSIVNGGNLFTPRIVISLKDEAGGEAERFDMEIKRNNIKQETSTRIREIMGGMGVNEVPEPAQMRDYTCGVMYGKAKKYDGNGALVQGKEVSTFICFGTTSNPKYIVMVTLNGIDEADGNELAAAKYAEGVMNEVLKYALLPPDKEGALQRGGDSGSGGDDGNEDDGLVAAPDLVDMGAQAARDAAVDAGFTYEDDGSGTVTSQEPAAGERVQPGSKIMLYMDYKRPESGPGEDAAASPDGADTITVPDFSGLSLTEARDKAIASGLKFYAQGTGVAKKQFPLYGTSVPRNSAVTVTFRLEIG